MIARLVKFYKIMPGDLRKLPIWEFVALSDWMPVLEAERDIAFADLLFTFAQTAQTADDARQQQRRRERYITIRKNVIKKVRDLYEDRVEILEEVDELLQTPRVDFSKLTDEQKAEIKAWAESIGAK